MSLFPTQNTNAPDWFDIGYRNDNAGEVYTIDGANSDFEGGDVSGVFSNAWNALAIYGQYRAIDAQYDEQPAPNSEIVTKNDEGNYLAGTRQALQNAPVMNYALIGLAVLLIGATTYNIVND